MWNFASEFCYKFWALRANSLLKMKWDNLQHKCEKQWKTDESFSCHAEIYRPTLDIIILASKKFHTFKVIRYIRYFHLATLAFLHNNMYKNSVKLATLKIIYLR